MKLEGFCATKIKYGNVQKKTGNDVKINCVYKFTSTLRRRKDTHYQK